MKNLSTVARLLMLGIGTSIGLQCNAATYPDSPRISLYVSTGTVSTWTETAAEDYLVPDSQVFITGRGLGASNFLGLLGVLIDRSNNAVTASSVEAALHQNFAQTLSRAIASRIAGPTPAGRAIQIDTAEGAQLTLLPSAKLTVSDDSLAMLSFRLTVRVDGEKKEFYYIVADRKPVVGPGSWSDQNAKALLESASVALPRLVDVLLDDMAGVFADPVASRQKAFVAFRGNDKAYPYYAAQLLRDYPAYVATTTCIGRQMSNFITVIERAALAPDQDGSKLFMKCGNV